MAKLLGVRQDSVSKIERRSDMLLSTFRSYIEAMGGKLRLVVEFPDAVAEVTSLGESDDDDDTPKRPAKPKRPPGGKRPELVRHPRLAWHAKLYPAARKMPSMGWLAHGKRSLNTSTITKRRTPRPLQQRPLGGI